MQTPIKYFFFDTEFANFSTLAPLSIGIISEDNQHDFYQEVSDFNIEECSDFVQEVVIPLMKLEEYGQTYKELSESLIRWINKLPCKEAMFISDYDGDIIILERFLSEPVATKLEKKISLKLISKAFLSVSMERGLYNHQTVHKSFAALNEGISESLMKNPEMQHHALFDAIANRDGWVKGLKSF